MRSISFIIPCYNEEKRLDKTFRALEKVRLGRGVKLTEVIFVDNGSTDKTFTKLSEIAQEYTIFPISIVSYKKMLGRKNAVAQGVKVSHSDINIVLSSDLSNLGEELKKLKSATIKTLWDLDRLSLPRPIKPIFGFQTFNLKLASKIRNLL